MTRWASAQASTTEAEFRSRAGKLLARISPRGVEIRCARSKCVEVLSWDELAELHRELERRRATRSANGKPAA